MIRKSIIDIFGITKYNDYTDEELSDALLAAHNARDEVEKEEIISEMEKRDIIDYDKKVSKMTPEEYRKFRFETHWD